MQLGHRLVEREQDEFTIGKVYRNVEPFMYTKKKVKHMVLITSLPDSEL